MISSTLPSLTATWIDAHNHLQDQGLKLLGDSLADRLPSQDFLCLVNGTSPCDWGWIASQCTPVDLSARPLLLPAFGLHPWKLDERTPNWLEELDMLLDLPYASLGEVGLDRWIKNSDFSEQLRVLHAQLELVEQRQLPISFHCLKAWNDLRGQVGKWLGKHPRPFLLHAYSGPASEVDYWLGLGAWFSFSPYFLHPRKQAVRELFRTLPLDRLLVETDAPSMVPPDHGDFQILHGPDGQAVNPPGNLIPTYQALAELRDLPIEVLKQQIADNFSRFYLTRSGGRTG